MNDDPVAEGRLHSPAADRNRGPILEVLASHLVHARKVLEIGSGTGQHAVFFAAALPHLAWQCTERPAALDGMRPWLAEAALPNLLPPIALTAGGAPWPPVDADVAFTANTLHIMGWPEVEALFAELGRQPALRALVVYGPFRYGGRHTSASNEAFDRMLAEQAPHRGVRDFEAVDALARAGGWRLVEDRAMPANNRCLVWTRRG